MIFGFSHCDLQDLNLDKIIGYREVRNGLYYLVYQGDPSLLLLPISQIGFDFAYPFLS